uniref:BtpA family protein n=1 Tax=Glossina morsitans morsitans TaxID=37546 RepID=A0A1B0FIA0_GLOMM
MQRFSQVFGKQTCNIIGMVHLGALPDHDMGPEIVACMSKIAQEIKNTMPPSMPVGIQILASANEQAMAVAKACNLQYIRCEGISTGQTAKLEDVLSLKGHINVPLIVGSGVTGNNLKDYFYNTQAVIVGSHFKQEGQWANDLCERAIETFMHAVNELTCKDCLKK